MASDRERFWEHGSFAVVGHTAKRAFPRLTYRGLKLSGKKVFPVDPSTAEVEGDRTYPDFDTLPEKVEAAILELPREETTDWVRQAADAGIRDVWLHVNTDTPEALSLAKEKDLQVLTGTCAVMYVTPGFTFHSIHKWIQRIRGEY